MPGHSATSNCTACEEGYVPAASGRCLPCPPAGCGVHGTCAPPVRDTVRFTARCQCDVGWIYADVSDDTSQCTVCAATGHAYNATDAGEDCVACDPLCASRGRCLPGGVCACTHPTAGPPRCAGCADGHARHPGTGLCEPCAGCAAGANCTINPATGDTACVCPPGRVGLLCDQCGPVGMAAENANGTCVQCPGEHGCPQTHECALDGSGAAVCACPAGWYGPECSVCDADACAAQCGCARRDPGAACLRQVGPDGTPAVACRCGPGHTHAVPGDDTSVCRPCGDMETPLRCLTCPVCDAASETCIEAVGDDGAVATCVCSPGWSPVPGFKSAGCLPAATTQLLMDAVADDAAAAARDLFADSVRARSEEHLGFTVRDMGSTENGGAVVAAIAVCGLMAAAAGGVIAVAGLKCRAKRVPASRKKK